MAIIPEAAQEMFKKVPDVIFSTANEQGQPNSCIVGMKAILDDETVYLSDQFFKKTYDNFMVNPKCAIVYWEGHEAYQLHGTVEYVTEGSDVFAAQSAWVNAAFEKMGMPIKAKGGCIVKVDAVYTSAAGPHAGEQIA